MCVAAEAAGWFFVQISERKKERSSLVVLSFEVEVKGRGPYTEVQEMDLASQDPRYYIEDLSEDEDCTERNSSCDL